MLISDGRSLPQCWQVSCPPPPRLVSSHLISLPLLSFLLLSSPLSTVQTPLHFGTFRVTVSRLFYHLRAIVYHFRVAHNVHTHTAIETHFHYTFVMWISRQKKAGLSKTHHHLDDETQAEESAESFLLSSVLDRGFYILMADLKNSSKQIYLHYHRKVKHRKTLCFRYRIVHLSWLIISLYWLVLLHSWGPKNGEPHKFESLCEGWDLVLALGWWL